MSAATRLPRTPTTQTTSSGRQQQITESTRGQQQSLLQPMSTGKDEPPPSRSELSPTETGAKTPETPSPKSAEKAPYAPEPPKSPEASQVDAKTNAIAIREVEAVVETMRAEHSPLASHIFVSRRFYQNKSDTKSGKRHHLSARLSWQEACDLGFRGNFEEWERLMGAASRRS